VIHLGNGDWVLVADGKKALFLCNKLNARKYDLRAVWHETSDNPASHTLGTDRPGRANSAPGARGAALQETDWHQLAEDQFAEETAAVLNRAVRDGTFSKNVLVVPPAVLGELRAKLTPDTKRTVLAEIPKTLTNHPIDKIDGRGTGRTCFLSSSHSVSMLAQSDLILPISHSARSSCSSTVSNLPLRRF